MMTNVDLITSEAESRPNLSAGAFVQLARDIHQPTPDLMLTIPAGEYCRILDVDPENGDLVLFGLPVV
jgi:hypothetical protein